jgi:hypothetical protein
MVLRPKLKRQPMTGPPLEAKLAVAAASVTIPRLTSIHAATKLMIVRIAAVATGRTQGTGVSIMGITAGDDIQTRHQRYHGCPSSLLKC